MGTERYCAGSSSGGRLGSGEGCALMVMCRRANEPTVDGTRTASCTGTADGDQAAVLGEIFEHSASAPAALAETARDGTLRHGSVRRPRRPRRGSVRRPRRPRRRRSRRPRRPVQARPQARPRRRGRTHGEGRGCGRGRPSQRLGRDGRRAEAKEIGAGPQDDAQAGQGGQGGAAAGVGHEASEEGTRRWERRRRRRRRVGQERRVEEATRRRRRRGRGRPAIRQRARRRGQKTPARRLRRRRRRRRRAKGTATRRSIQTSPSRSPPSSAWDAPRTRPTSATRPSSDA